MAEDNCPYACATVVACWVEVVVVALAVPGAAIEDLAFVVAAAVVLSAWRR